MIALGYGAFLKDFLTYSETSLSKDIDKIYVDEKYKISNSWNGYELITDLSNYESEEFICALTDPFHNLRLYNYAISCGLKLTNNRYITKLGNEEISKDIEIGKGTLIGPYVAIYSNTTIGESCQIVNHALISHNITIDNFNMIMGGYSTIGGYSNIGKSNFFGQSCHISNNIFIGSMCSIGIGSVVVKDIPDNKICIGNPAKILNKSKLGVKNENKI